MKSSTDRWTCCIPARLLAVASGVMLKSSVDLASTAFGHRVALVPALAAVEILSGSLTRCIPVGSADALRRLPALKSSADL